MTGEQTLGKKLLTLHEPVTAEDMSAALKLVARMNTAAEVFVGVDDGAIVLWGCPRAPFMYPRPERPSSREAGVAS